jgi:hypothetical protein
VRIHKSIYLKAEDLEEAGEAVPGPDGRGALDWDADGTKDIMVSTSVLRLADAVGAADIDGDHTVDIDSGSVRMLSFEVKVGVSLGLGRSEGVSGVSDGDPVLDAVRVGDADVDVDSDAEGVAVVVTDAVDDADVSILKSMSSVCHTHHTHRTPHTVIHTTSPTVTPRAPPPFNTAVLNIHSRPLPGCHRWPPTPRLLLCLDSVFPLPVANTT